jgi:CheY-like chemotaxis protein
LTLIAGRKLLLADDSVAIQKVVDLTFSDEGMEVTTVGDGRLALEKLEQNRPDIVLADVFMPGVGGYELCQFIKQSERFNGIPVMLLVGSFEPFDEAEARRVGADDVVTKPFQSIRQLVSRVGSLLGGKSAEEEAAHEYSTLGLGRANNAAPAAPDSDAITEAAETNVTVFVEAPSMTSPESHDVAEATRAADIELQTADTMKLEPIDDEPMADTLVPVNSQITDAIAQTNVKVLGEAPAVAMESSPTFEPVIDAQADTIETGPVVDVAMPMDSLSEVESDERVSTIGAPEMDDKPTEQTAPPAPPPVLKDTLLDLYEYDDSTRRALAEDVILDLDFEEPVSQPAATVLDEVPEPTTAIHAVAPTEVITVEPTPEEQPVVASELQEWALVPEAPAENVLPVTVIEETQAPSSGHDVSLGLSPEAIDAIARRVVEQLSDRVVREIVWEVVPELAELLIKKKLEEQK